MAIANSNNSVNRLEWSDFFDEANIPMVGYDIASDSIVIFIASDRSVDSSGDILYFDVKLGSWTKGKARYTATSDISNPVINSDGELVIVMASNASTMDKFDSSPAATSNFELQTKAFDMGSPSSYKRLYNISLEYIGTTADNVSAYVQYDQNGTWISLGALTSSSTYTIKKLEIDGSNRVDCHNVMFKFAATGSLSSVFELSSYSVSYRIKQPR